MGLKLRIHPSASFACTRHPGRLLDGDDGENGETPTPLPSPADTTVVGRNISFSIDTLSATVGQQVTITFDNQDSGIPHNFHVLAGSQGDFQTEIRPGPNTQSVTFTIDVAGTYRFQCNVHPGQMNGTLTVQ